MTEPVYDDQDLYARIARIEEEFGLGADPEEVLAAARGDYGDEAQAQALQAIGLEFDGEGQYEDEGSDPQTEDYILNQANRLEQMVGRELTNNEFEVYASELLSGADPGAVTANFSQAVRGRTKDEDGRREVMTETMQEIEAAEQAAQGQGYDDDTYATDDSEAYPESQGE